MKTRLLNVFILAFLFMSAAGQNSQVLYFMKLPQNHLLNPALTPSGRIYVGIPGLTGFNVNITNNFFSFSDLITKGVEISKNSLPFLDPGYDPQTFLDKIKKLNYLAPQVSVQLIGLGVSFRNDLYIFLDVIDHAEANAVFPRDLIRLAFLGNGDFAGQTFDLRDFRTEAQYYREIGIGFSKKISPRLRIGATGKLLYGVASGEYSNKALSLAVDNDYTNSLAADISLRVSGPVDFFLDTENKLDDIKFRDSRFDNGGWRSFMAGSGNTGLGLDLGAEYEINQKIFVSAALTDLGFIRWKSDVTNMNGHGDLTLRGIDFADIREGSATLDDLGKNLADSLINSITFSRSTDPFTTYLHTGLAVGGKFNVTDKFSIGLLSYSRKVDRQVREAVTVSANLNLGNILSTTLAYTAGNASFSNIGAGLGVRGGFVQYYFLVDRIPLTWSRVSTGNNSFTMPANWNTINIRMGLNLVFGNRKAIRAEDTKE